MSILSQTRFCEEAITTVCAYTNPHLCSTQRQDVHSCWRAPCGLLITPRSIHLIRPAPLQNEKYRVSLRVYERQYAPLYYSRLNALKIPTQARAAALWPHLQGRLCLSNSHWQGTFCFHPAKVPEQHVLVHTQQACHSCHVVIGDRLWPLSRIFAQLCSRQLLH